MPFTKRGVILLIVVAIVIILAALFALNRPNSERLAPSASVPVQSEENRPTEENRPINLSETVFDASYPLADSGIAVEYPSNGFYGLGADVSEIPSEGDVMGGVHIETTTAFESSRIAEFVTLDVGVSQIDVDSLEAFVESIPPETYDGQYAALNGRYVLVNDHRYFLYRVTEDVTVQRAFGLDGQQLIGVSFSYKRGDDPVSLAAHENNDELFMEILERITYR